VIEYFYILTNEFSKLKNSYKLLLDNFNRLTVFNSFDSSNRLILGKYVTKPLQK